MGQAKSPVLLWTAHARFPALPLASTFIVLWGWGNCREVRSSLTASLWVLPAQHGASSLVPGKRRPPRLGPSLQHLQTGWDEGWGLALGKLLSSLCGIQKLLHITGSAKQHMACGLHAEEGPAKSFPGWNEKVVESKHKGNCLHLQNAPPSWVMCKQKQMLPPPPRPRKWERVYRYCLQLKGTLTEMSKI